MKNRSTMAGWETNGRGEKSRLESPEAECTMYNSRIYAQRNYNYKKPFLHFSPMTPLFYFLSPTPY